MILCVLVLVTLCPVGANAAVGNNEFYEIESNNAMQTADRIYRDYTVSGELSGIDLDFY